MLPTLHAGGAERVISFISQNLNPADFDVKLLVTNNEDEARYDVSGIEVVYLNKPQVRKSIGGIVRFLRKNKPDIVFSSLVHLNTVLSYISPFFPKTLFIGRETFLRVNTEAYQSPKVGWFHSFIASVSYKLLDYIICQSIDMAKDLTDHYHIKPRKLRIINNPITNEGETGISERKLCPPETAETVRFITVGRLSRIKGIPRVLRMLATLDYDWSYTIVGSGEEKEDLEQTVRELGIESRVRFIGYTSEITELLTTHHYFLQGSYKEGFPNALLESCVAGTPIIVFDAPGGTREIVEQGVNGYLAQDESEFAEFLNRRSSFDPESVRESVLRKFGKKKIIGEYEAFFKEIMRHQS